MSNPQEDKWIRVMCDFAATGLWSKSGSLASLGDVPISPDTFFRLGVWQHWYESRRHDEPINSLDKFVAYGLAIAKDIKAQLPEWVVIYHDESKHYTDPCREYEITEGELYNPWKNAKRRS